MKTIRSERLIKAAEELDFIIDSRKTLEKRERELKDLFKVELGEEKVAKVGDLIIVITDCTRTQIHKDKLIQDMGMDFVRKYEEVTSYKKVEIKG